MNSSKVHNSKEINHPSPRYGRKLMPLTDVWVFSSLYPLYSQNSERSLQAQLNLNDKYSSKAHSGVLFSRGGVLCKASG